jgi:ABC-type transport system involved in cytochrome bd biosynthesis fused ATPase/permease subunit
MAIYILIILYAVSSINVLLLILGLLPYLLDAFMETHILLFFVVISFMLAAYLSGYHTLILFHKRKRKTDTEEHEKMTLKKIWRRSRPISKILFVFVCIYAFISFYMVLWAQKIAATLTETDRDIMLIGFSIISLTLITMIAAYHLSTWILRQKRVTDHPDHPDNPANAQAPRAAAAE